MEKEYYVSINSTIIVAVNALNEKDALNNAQQFVDDKINDENAKIIAVCYKLVEEDEEKETFE